jgi:hypothetical protein
MYTYLLLTRTRRMVSETLSWCRGWRSAGRFLDCGAACVDGRRRISSWCRGWASPVRSVRKWLVVGGAFLVCGRGLCQWALPDWRGRQSSPAAFLKMLGHLGEELGGKGKLTRAGFCWLFFFFFFFNIIIYYILYFYAT